MYSLGILVRVGLEPQRYIASTSALTCSALEPQRYIASTSALTCSAVKRLEQVGIYNALTSVITLTLTRPLALLRDLSRQSD